jgi:hypothetical protein
VQRALDDAIQRAGVEWSSRDDRPTFACFFLERTP